MELYYTEFLTTVKANICVVMKYTYYYFSKITLPPLYVNLSYITGGCTSQL
jgi:hypothetical protein